MGDLLMPLKKELYGSLTTKNISKLEKEIQK